MKFLLKLVFAAAVLAGIILGLLLARPAIAQAPYNQSEYSDDIIKDNAITAIIPIPSSNARPSKPSGRDYSGKAYSKEEVIQLIKDYSAQYKISAELPLRVANCESGYNQFSKNRNSTASGVFQYIHSTWSHTESGLLGISPFDAEANIHMAIKSIASGGISNWNASKNCWS